MMVEEALKVLELQEEILQFIHFTNEDAWELGMQMVAEAKKRELPLSIRIQKNNGYIVFQYGNDKTTLDNQKWMERKANTVQRMEMSSLRFCLMLKEEEESLKDRGMDESSYAVCGGGFPIFIEEVGVVGAICVSGLDHVSDHDFAVKCISKYLHVDEIPRISAV